MPDPGEPTTADNQPTDPQPTTTTDVPAAAAGDPPADHVARWLVQRRLDAELATARGELARVDTRTSTLLGLAGVLLGGGLAVLAGTGRQLPAVVAVPAWAAATTVGAAVVLLASAVRPNLRGNHGFVRWCLTTSPHDLLDELAADEPLTRAADHLRWLSCALVVKYTAVRRAVTLLMVGLAGGALAVAAATWTG